jgi:hypothetical protein
VRLFKELEDYRLGTLAPTAFAAFAFAILAREGPVALAGAAQQPPQILGAGRPCGRPCGRGSRGGGGSAQPIDHRSGAKRVT